jgi:hypothetical protein
MSSCTIRSSVFFFFSSRYSCYYLVVAYPAVRQEYVLTGSPQSSLDIAAASKREREKKKERKDKKIVSVFFALQIHTHTILLSFVDVFFFFLLLLLLLLFVFSMHARKDQRKRYYFSFFVRVLRDNRACLSFCWAEVLRTKQRERKKEKFPKQHKKLSSLSS